MARPRIPTGTDALSNAVRWLLEQDERRKIIRSIDVAPSETTHGTSLRLIEARGGTTAGGSIVRFTFIADAGNHFTATSPGTGTVNIAKPYRLRVNPWANGPIPIRLEDGTANPPSTTVSYNYLQYTFRIATLATGGQETQVIIPQYYAGDYIFATEPTEGTGISGITWQDLNADGRAWAAL